MTELMTFSGAVSQLKSRAACCAAYCHRVQSRRRFRVKSWSLRLGVSQWGFCARV